MPYKDRRTPGVYVTELSAFPPSIVGVQTAVPAFIGYTEKAEISGKPVFLKPIRIGSMADFEEIFGRAYEPFYSIKQADVKEYDFKVHPSCESVGSPPVSPPVCVSPNTEPFYFYKLTQTNTSQFNLYNSMRFFYANGGGNCYVVSVNNYQGAVKIAEDETNIKDMAARAAFKDYSPLDVNSPLHESDLTSVSTPTPSTVKQKDLKKGLDVIRDQNGPTMLVIPEAVLLPSSGGKKTPWESSDFAILAKDMLTQCNDLQDRVALLDVYGSQYANKDNLDAIIEKFRVAVGGNFLNYGMAYFPFLNSTVVGAGEYNYTNVDDSSSETPLATILEWENYNVNYDSTKSDGGKRYTDTQIQIGKMATATDDEANSLNQNLVATLPLLGDIERIMTTKNDVLPPSGAMAGIYTFIDSTRGVWNAPANTTLSSVDSTIFKINDGQQADLNMPVDGKAVNAIRDFIGRGTVIWGARTLDGNSNDYRYIQVRRTLIYIEQSIKNALNGFVFAPNDGNTWVTVTAMASNFLQDLWSRGGLMGAKASDAFDVQCGLGSTMTPTDILNGYMIVQVRLQMIRPAEFIELTFKQKMQGIS
jgi:phage tail sheath protein FI